MAEQLEHLIERIQKDAIAKSEQHADDILEKAEQQAARIIQEAEDKAASLIEKAKQDAASAGARGQRTLEQACRDTLIRTEQGLEKIISGLVEREVSAALGGDTVQQMLVKIAEGFAANQAAGLTALVAKEDLQQLTDYFSNTFQSSLNKGVDIQLDESLKQGFRVSKSGKKAFHDFSREAIAETLSAYLNPQLAKILRETATEESA